MRKNVWRLSRHRNCVFDKTKSTLAKKAVFQSLAAGSILGMLTLQIMNFGFPQDLTPYKLFTDWGSLVAGGIALVAAVIAYIAGVCQARATREAANLQIAAIERQKNEEIANVRDAVRIEVTALVKYIMGAIGLCGEIVKGTVKILAPRRALHRKEFLERSCDLPGDSR